MDSRETQAFAERLMREVWEPFAAEAVPRFYHRDMIGHHRKQQLTYDDVVHRLVTDHPRYPNPKFDIKDIVAAEDKFASCSRRARPPGSRRAEPPGKRSPWNATISTI